MSASAKLLVGPPLKSLTPAQLEELVLIGRRDLSELVEADYETVDERESIHPKYKFIHSQKDILGEGDDERITFYEWRGGQTDCGEEWDYYPCEIRVGSIVDSYAISFPEVAVVRWFLNNGWSWVS